MTHSFFITSTGTDIGKTFITQGLIHQLRAAGRGVHAYKPLISGFDEAVMQESDSGQLLEALGRDITLKNIEAISPWRFSEPLSPHSAAEIEGRSIDIPALCEWCREKTNEDGITLIEGVGGVMVPLNREVTVLDWMAALKLPVILVVGSYLGTLSHTLTALHALNSRHLEIAGIVISESSEEATPAQETAEGLRGLVPETLPILRAPYAKEGFTELPNLLSLCDERPATARPVEKR